VITMRDIDRWAERHPFCMLLVEAFGFALVVYCIIDMLRR